MKSVRILAFLFAALVPVVAHAQSSLTSLTGEDAQATGSYVIREFVGNASPDDWLLDPGWTWSDGSLTHEPGAVASVARQVTMPPMTKGRTYRVGFRFAGTTKGDVTISIGGVNFPARGAEGGWGETFIVKDPTAFLTLTASRDFDGTLKGIGVIELGDELADGRSWIVPHGWAQKNDRFRYEAGWSSPLERVVNTVPGHIYRVYFNADVPTHGPWKGTVTLGGASPTRFGANGSWNYEYEIVAGQGTLVSFAPLAAAETEGDAPSGSLGRISVREITSDATGSR